MLCSTCPVRSTCKSICPEVQRDLARFDRPQFEYTKTPTELEEIELQNALAAYYAPEVESETEEQRENSVVTADHEVIRSALRSLTDRQRECLRLFFWDGLSKNKIGERLGISRPAVFKNIKAAIAKVRVHLTATPDAMVTLQHIYSEGA